MSAKITLTLLITCLTILPVAAQQKPYDCNTSAAHRQFDFWLGNWAVSDAEGNLQGHNTISTVQRACALEEKWQSVKGGTGQSINYYQPGEEKWRQVWVDGGSSIIDISGGIVNDSMKLRGTIYYLGSGQERPFRGKWTPLPDGRVRQFFEEKDKTGQWRTWFEGFYMKQAAKQ